MLIANYTLDSPFASMQRLGWGAALAMAAVILTINLAVRSLSGTKGK